MMDAEQSLVGATPDRTPSDKRIRLCVVVTIDLTILNLCRGRLEFLQARGFDVTVVCAPTRRADDITARGVRLFTAPLSRSISPLKDAVAVWRLFRFLRRERFEIVEVSTPKAALLGAIAARLAGVPCVVHLLRGLVYPARGVVTTGRRGLTRFLVRWSQRLACRMAHRVISISRQTRDQAVADGICTPSNITVLGSGSSNGVDLKRFRAPTPEDRRRACERLDLPPDVTIAGFVGRVTKDKGIVELVNAFHQLSRTLDDLHLLIVGDVEQRDQPDGSAMRRIAEHPRIHMIGWHDDTAELYHAMDFLVLPTHREGFGTVLLEAAACGVPAITTPAAGWWDVVRNEREALCVPVGHATALKEAMERLARNAELRQRCGRAARATVTKHYAQQVVWAQQEREFRRLLR